MINYLAPLNSEHATVLRQAQQPSKVMWLLNEVEVQQLGAYKIPPDYS
jgi:hypothetical protein